MASNNRSSGTAAFRYASALVDTALGSDAIPQIEQDVADLSAMLSASADLQSLIRSPLLKAAAQQEFLKVLADKAKLSPLTKNFLLLLAQNRRLKDLESMLKAVTENISSRRGELRANVETAVALSPDQKKSLENSLGKTVGRPVLLNASVNKDLIGGMVVTLGSLMVDDSVKSKLDRLNRAMKHTGTKAA